MKLFEIDQSSVRSKFKEEIITFRNALQEFFWDEQSSIVLLEGPAGSGKTFCYLQKIFRICDQNPGIRVLLLRQNRVDLTESVLQPWDVDILPKGHPCKPGHKDGERANRKRPYRFPNGSEVHFGGILQRTNLADEEDTLGRLKSTQWDVIAIEEATEVAFDAIQVAYSRLRADGVTWKQLILAYNPPSDPEHHIYRFIGKRGVKFYKTYHTDNPKYCVEDVNGDQVHPDNQKKYSLTTKGKQYIEEILGNLSGSMADRFLHGRAAIKPGLVHPEFEMGNHTVSQEKSLLEFVKGLDLTREQKTKYLRDNYMIDLSVDFGHSHPNTTQIFARPINDGIQFDGRVWKFRRIAEFYKTQVVSDEMAKLVLNWCGYTWDQETETFGYLAEEDYPEGSPGFVIPLLSEGLEQIAEVITDHQLESRVLFEQGSGLQTKLANKTLESGIRLVSTVLRDYQIIFDLYEPMFGIDFMNNRHGKPCGLHQEFSRYRFQKMLSGYGKRPIPLMDDGCTALRYYLADMLGLEDKPLTYATARKEYSDSEMPVTIWNDESIKEREMEYLFGKAEVDARGLF